MNFLEIAKVRQSCRSYNPDRPVEAEKLQAVLERETPGITRSTVLRAQRFNQDLSPGCLLVEVGAAGNTHAEALRAAGKLAEGILALAAEDSP